jgi:hypothetical protein
MLAISRKESCFRQVRNYLRVREVLGEIPLEGLAHVFEHWMERVEWVSQNNGGYHP